MQGNQAALEDWLRDHCQPIADRLIGIGVEGDAARAHLHQAFADAFLLLSGGGRIKNEIAWLSDTLGRIAAKSGAAPVAGHSEAALDDLAAREVEPDLDRDDHQAHLRARITAKAALLPEPYRRIIELRGLHGYSLEQVFTHLQSWRPVTIHACGDSNKRASEMMRHAWAGGDPHEKWPERYNPKKNPWTGTPPPPIPCL